MDDLEFIRAELEKMPLSAMDDLGEKTGIPRDTLIKLKYGTTKNPRYETVRQLLPYLRAKAAA